MDALKAEQITGSKWRVLAIPFGGPFKGKDFDGEFFDHETDIKPHWFKARPVMFHHGNDQEAKDEEYGEEEMDDTAKTDGWWGTMWLNRSARYWAEVDRMLRVGKMYGSSGSISHLVRKNHKTGHIDVWPHAEQTLTLTPANPYARITAAKALASFDTAGIAMDDRLKSALAALDEMADDLPATLSDSGDASADLGTDGEQAAMRRLVIALDDLEQLIHSI